MVQMCRFLAPMSFGPSSGPKIVDNVLLRFGNALWSWR